MSHFAKVKNGMVDTVIVAEQDFINSGVVGTPSNWIQTSYTNSIRKQYAGIGYTYDSVKDEFVEPKPHDSWTLDSNNDWQPPAPKPDGHYLWNESTDSWDEIT